MLVGQQLCSVMTPTALHSCKFSVGQKTCYQALLWLLKSTLVLTNQRLSWGGGGQSEGSVRIQCYNNEKLLRFCTCCAIKCWDNEFFKMIFEILRWINMFCHWKLIKPWRHCVGGDWSGAKTYKLKQVQTETLQKEWRLKRYVIVCKVDKSFSCRLCGISLTKCQNWPACKFPPLSKPSPLAARIGTSFPQKTIFAKLKIPQKWQRPYITPLFCQSNIGLCFNCVAKTVKQPPSKWS